MTVAELIAKLIALDTIDDRTTEVIVGTHEMHLGSITDVYVEDGQVCIVAEDD